MYITKKQMPLGKEKDIENTLAETERLKAKLEYIAICDHPELLEEEASDEQIL